MKVRMHVITMPRRMVTCEDIANYKPTVSRKGLLWAFFCAVPVWMLLIWLWVRAL